jgi:2,4-dienoyl-CoA reductase-like NADH-dependent reductase (Old Yellow Enzyme family)
MSTSHAISYDVEGKPKERYQLYHEEKAKGGIALTMFGGSSNIAPDSPSVFGQLYVGDDSVIPYFRSLADRIHKYDCALMCQITHMGRRTSAYAGDWLPIIAPSPIRETLHRGFPREMDRFDIDRVTNAFAAAAVRCKEGGLDGCELLAGGHLLGQFISPFANKRTDEYGGPLRNRMRFPFMVLRAVRRAVGSNFIVGIRLPVVEGGVDGMSSDECFEVAKQIEATGDIDFLNLYYGRMDTTLALAEQNMPGMGAPLGPYVEHVKSFAANLALPIFHASRIVDLATARYAIAEGNIDMVGMTRAHLADPYIVEKLSQGREGQIRPCVGATYCLSRRLCIHNPATGREAKLPHKIERSMLAQKKVVVVGGGPAGMEAARVCAMRGHRVVLFEAAGELGGQIKIASRVSWRKDLEGISDWLSEEIDRLGVTIRCNTYADEQSILLEEPDVVVVATGGIPEIPLPSAAHKCVTVWDILTGSTQPADEIIVFDGTGQIQAASCADMLASRGCSVEFISADVSFGVDIPYPTRVLQQKRLYQKGCSIPF